MMNSLIQPPVNAPKALIDQSKIALDNSIYAVELINDILDNPNLSHKDINESLYCVLNSLVEVNNLFAKTIGVPYRTNG